MLKQYAKGVFSLYSSKRGKLAEFTNLITDVGLDHLILTSMSSSHGIVVGRGTTPPAVGNTALETIVNGSTTSSPRFSSGPSVLSGTPYYGTRYRIAKRFNAGQITGNISELGCAYFTGTSRTSGYTLISRALIKNAEGVPTTIPILSDEVLDVVYDLYFYTSTADVQGTIVLDGNIGGTYEWVLRPAVVTTLGGSPYPQNVGWNGEWSFSSTSSQILINFSNQALGGITVELPGAATNGSGADVLFRSGSFVPGSFQVPFALSIPPSAGNISGGIRSIQFKMGKGMYQLQFTPAIPKTALDSLVLEMVYSVARAS